jgi:hypothetical protein
MSARKPLKEPPRPPPLPQRASRTRAAPAVSPTLEFLADEFVEDEVDEFLPQEFVVEDSPGDSAVGFAGPSDPPPHMSSLAQPVTRRPEPPHTTVLTARAPGMFTRSIPTVAAAAFGFLAVALALRARPPAITTGDALPAALSPSVSPPPSQPVPGLPTPAEATISATAAAAPAPEVDTPATPSATTPAAPRPDTSAAIEAKRASQKALEHDRVSQAITLGERSVELDATDAESWLILGAAYLQRGSLKDARRCFSTCVKEATHGARGECAALLR